MDRVHGYIREQPDVLERTFDRVPEQLGGALRDGEVAGDLLLVGSGTSRNALIATEHALATAPRGRVATLGPMEFLRQAGRWRPGSLAVFLSQSGSSTTTIQALERAQTEGIATLALTAMADSPFARAADRVVVMPIGDEPVGPKTKGYTASLATLMTVAAVLGDRPAPLADPKPFVADLADRIEGWEAWADDVAVERRDVRHVMVLGTDRHMATALEASLKLQEMAGISASAWDTEEGLHGRFHGLDEHGVAVFLAASADQVELAQDAADVLADLGIATLLVDIGGYGGASADAGAGSDAHRLVVPDAAGRAAPLDLITAIVPFQCLAASLARSRGLDPADMKYPGLSAKLGIKRSS